VRAIAQHVQQVRAAGKGDVNQVNSAAQMERTEIRPTGEDGVLNDYAPIALHTPALKVSFEDTRLDQQTGIKVRLLEVRDYDMTVNQFHHFVARAPLQVEPV